MIQRLKHFFKAEGWNKTYWIAYSGGLDSHVMLHLAAEICKEIPLKLRAIHINHNISPNASAWQMHCETICRHYQIDFISKNSKTQLSGPNLEERARETRYQLLSELLMPGDYLLTAHHLDDQAETLLLQLMRGAGVKGLSAMPMIKPFGQGLHARPFLNVTRDDLHHYAVSNHLTWIEDESNDSDRFARNFLRREIVPLLKKRWPSINKTLARTAEHCAETQTVLTKIALDDLNQLQGSYENTLSIQQLKRLDESRQRLSLRLWFEKCGFPIPSTVKMRDIETTLLQAEQDKNPMIRWGDAELRRYRDDLYILPYCPVVETQPISWDLKNSLSIPHFGILKVECKEGQGLHQHIQHCEIRFRQGGERCYFARTQNHRTLKNLLQEWGVPPWMRSRIPLIFVDNQLAMVPGLFLDERFATDANSKGYQISILKK